MSTPIRLNKVLKELNISLDRAVEFLSSKNIEIEPRPTSKIDDETYRLLLNEFQTDKSDKDKLEEINIKKKKELEEKQILEEKTEQTPAEELNAVLAASIFHYGKHSVKEAKEYLDSKGIPVRI